MPTDALLLSIGVCAVFLLFAFVVAWADHSTSQWLRDKATAKQSPGTAKPHEQKAA